jgi:hypothetical protein
MRQKISLACIAGNAEKYIGRFLDSFQPHFDEVVIVRATGNQPPDETLAIARCRGCKTGIYSNAKDWPHVDDFAAARNKAFDLASGDIIMWADMDDVISPESAAALLDAISRMPADCDGLEFPYEVPDDGVTVMRERVIRKGRARWVSPIHEHLVFVEGAKVASSTSGKILHHQIGDRRPNDERNLRILESIPPEERTLSHRFHLFQSLRVCGREEEASQVAVDLLTNPPKEMGDAEKFELFIAAGQMVQDINTRSNLILQALGTDPSRREGYGEMALCMIAMGKPKSALGFTTAMRSLRQHGTADWNARRKYYSWLGEHIHGMALRANGRIEEADAVETNHFIRSGAKFSLLHATRGRPAFAAGNRRKWLETAANPDAIEHIFAIDADDEDSFPLMVHRHIMLKGNGGPVAAWNAAAQASAGEVMVQLSDDFHPFQGWDTAILDAIGDTSKPAVLAVSDGHRTDDLLCMAILTRQRWKNQGELFHPEFFSMYSDNLFSERAFRDGVVIDARDRITFEHFHPAFGKGDMDQTYARSNSTLNYQAGEGALRRIRAGVRVSTEVEGFCDYRDFYAHVAHTLKPDAVAVEIGSWMGQSAVYFCQRLQDFGKRDVVLHCVDTFKGEDNQPVHYATVAAQGGNIRHVFEDNIIEAQVADMIRIHEGDSAQSAEDFADGSLDFVFIDAAHDYASVVKDLAAWFPKLKPDGIFAGHDYPWHEVKRAVDEHASANGYSIKTWGRCWIKNNSPA